MHDGAEPARRPLGLRKLVKAAAKKSANSGGLALVILGLLILISTLAPGFTSPFNIFSLTRNLAIDTIIGFGMMVVLALGHMNLALGAIGVCAVMVTGYGLQQLGLPVAVAIAGGMAAGIVLGALNGLLIVRTGLHSFIITLATSSLFLGLMLIMTKAQSFNALPSDFTDLGKGRVGAFSVLLVVTLTIGLALGVLFKFTTLGRYILASGANPVAASLSGVPVRRTIIITHALSGLLAAMAGVMVTMRLSAALPSIGEDWLLPSFLAPLLGGTLMAGGYVSVLGTVLGAILVTVLQNGLVLMEISGFWIQFFLGLALLAAVGIDRWRTVSSRKSK